MNDGDPQADWARIWERYRYASRMPSGWELWAVRLWHRVTGREKR